MFRNSFELALTTLSLLLILAGGCGRQETESVFGDGPRRIIVVSLDCLRADHMGCYGYGRETSPFLDGLAAESTLFTRATAPSNWTLPSHVSLFTGLYPSHHGVLQKHQSLAETIGSLVEPLKAAGFATGAVTGGGFLRAKFGHDRGFDYYKEARQMSGALPGTLSDAETWLRTHKAEDTFLFVHTYEIHMPYTPPRAYVTRILGDAPTEFTGTTRNMIDLKARGEVTETDIREVAGHYDACIAYTDELLGAWIRRLEATGLAGNLLLIVSSDHGEAFWEHGAHGHNADLLGSGVTDVPLIVRLPGTPHGAEGRVSDIECSFMDIMPTVLEAAGLSRPKGLDGFSLLPELTGRPASGPDRKARERREVRLESGRFGLGISEGLNYDAVRAGALKAVIAKTDRGEVAHWPGFYNLDADPGERSPLPPIGNAYRELTESLESLLGERRPAVDAVDESKLDPETRRQLEALGYI